MHYSSSIIRIDEYHHFHFEFVRSINQLVEIVHFHFEIVWSTNTKEQKIKLMKLSKIIMNLREYKEQKSCFEVIKIVVDEIV